MNIFFDFSMEIFFDAEMRKWKYTEEFKVICIVEWWNEFPLGLNEESWIIILNY